MSFEAGPGSALDGWRPILGAFSIWFAHFFVVYTAALIWPHDPLSRLVAAVATFAALIALAVLYRQIRAAEPVGGQARFGRRFGLGSIFIAAAGTVFDAVPPLFG